MRNRNTFERVLMSVIFFITSGAVLCMVLTSCLDEQGTGTMRLYLTSGSAKTLAVDESLTDITRYSVTGNGPGGKTFTIDTTSTSVIIEGVSLGTWSVYVGGYSTKGKLISEGEAKFKLTAESSPVTVTLDKIKGNGSAQLRFEWDASVSDPQLHIEIKNKDFSNTIYSKTISPTNGGTYTTMGVSELPAGSYIFHCVLYNGSTHVSGAVEVVRLSAGEKTTGTISFASDAEYSQDLANLNVFYKTGSPITGHISGIDETVASNTETVASLLLDRQYDGAADYVVQWYLDGEPVGEPTALAADANYTVITAGSGTHILNAVVYSPTLGHAGSAGIKFSASPTGTVGEAVTETLILPESTGVSLGESTFIGALPDGKFVAASARAETIQLFSVLNSTLVVEQEFTSADPGFEWIPEMTGLWSDPQMNTFVISDNGVNADFMYYNPRTGLLGRAKKGDTELRCTGQLSTPYVPFTGGIETVAFWPTEDGGGSILILPAGIKKAAVERCVAEGPYTESGTLMSTDIVQTGSLVLKGGNMVITDRTSGTFRYSSFDGETKTIPWQGCTTDFTSIPLARFISENMVIVSDGNSLCVYSYSANSRKWNWKSTILTTAKDAAVLADGNFFYVISADNKLQTFAVRGSVILRISVVQMERDIDRLVINGNTLLCIASDGSVNICTVITE